MSEKLSTTERIERQLREMGPDYLRRREAELKGVQGEGVDRNLKLLETLGHRMKGSAKSYGYEMLGAFGAELEQAAHNEQAQEVRLILSRILSFISSINSPSQTRE